MDSIKVGNAICSILTSNEDLKSLVGDKVFPLVANEDTTFPFIVYKRESTTPTDSKDQMIISYQSYIDIYVISDNYDEGVEIASLVGDILKGRKGIVSGINIDKISYEGDDEDYTEDAFIQKIYFKILIK